MKGKNPVKPRVKDAVLRYMYDHKKDPPSNVAWQIKLVKLKASRATVGDYLYALRTLESRLDEGPLLENKITKEFGKYMRPRIRTWLNFLTQEEVYEVQGKKGAREYRVKNDNQGSG